MERTAAGLQGAFPFSSSAPWWRDPAGWQMANGIQRIPAPTQPRAVIGMKSGTVFLMPFSTLLPHPGASQVFASCQSQGNAASLMPPSKLR